jgi:hypothetical protein
MALLIQVRKLQQLSVEHGAPVVGVTDAFCRFRAACKRACRVIHSTDKSCGGRAAKRQASVARRGAGGRGSSDTQGKLTALRVRPCRSAAIQLRCLGKNAWNTCAACVCFATSASRQYFNLRQGQKHTCFCSCTRQVDDFLGLPLPFSSQLPSESALQSKCMSQPTLGLKRDSSYEPNDNCMRPWCLFSWIL